MADEPVRAAVAFARAESDTAYVGNPWRRYVAGDHFVLWCAGPALQGFAVWGDPPADQVRRLFAIRSRLLHSAHVVPHHFLVDLTRIERVGAGAFAEFARFVSGHGDILKEKNLGMGVVRPRAGMVAAMVAGYPDVAPGQFPTRIFTDISEALAWMGVASPGPIAAALAELQRELDEQTPLLPALRALLNAHLLTITSATAARLLSTSQRTLARRLAALGTSFRRELRAARAATRRGYSSTGGMVTGHKGLPASSSRISKV